jgi:uncharacterized protein YqeY
MGLMKDLDDRLKAAMRAKDERALKVIRMVRTRLKDHAREARVEGDLSDDDVRRIVAAYVKQLKKSLPEFEKGGQAAQAAIAGIQFEIDYLEPFLPTLLDEQRTRELVRAAVEALGTPPIQKAGLVIGRIMKEHRDEVDPLLVKRLVEETLGR